MGPDIPDDRIFASPYILEFFYKVSPYVINQKAGGFAGIE